jgi:hypothetical protein
MIHVLNDFSTNYNLQLPLLKKRTIDKEKPLPFEERTSELILNFERLSMKSKKLG